MGNYQLVNPYPFQSERKRPPVRKNLKKWLLKEVQGGKCKRCGNYIKSMGVRPILHHKDLNPKNNKPENLMVICPNCHDKIHQKEKKVVKIRHDKWGVPRRIVVKKNFKKIKRKIKKSKPKKRRQRGLRLPINPFKF